MNISIIRQDTVTIVSHFRKEANGFLLVAHSLKRSALTHPHKKSPSYLKDT